MKNLFLITCLSLFSLATSSLNAKTISLSDNFNDTFIAENISIFDAKIIEPRRFFVARKYIAFVLIYLAFAIDNI